MLSSLSDSARIILALLSLPALGGLALFGYGIWPRRSDSDPYCRRCGYNLRGRASDRCSECGADLRARHAICSGRWRRRWGVAWLGIVIAVLTAPAAIYWYVDWTRAAGMWLPLFPNQMLVVDLMSLRTPFDRWAADELLVRLQRTGLDVQTRDALFAFGMRAIRARADSPIGSSRALPLLCALYRSKTLSEAQKDLFEYEALGLIDIDAPKVVAVGEARWVSARYALRAPKDELWIEVRLDRVFVNGQQQSQARRYGRFIPLNFESDEQRTRFGTMIATRPGRNEVEFELSIRYFDRASEKEIGSRTELVSGYVWAVHTEESEAWINDQRLISECPP